VILVTLGTLHFPFDRLLRALDSLPADEELVVQCRVPGPLPAHARSVTDLPFDELAETMRAARVVVCHAGVGSVLTALANGKRPVTVPRLARFGEAVDDHQLAFARRLAEAGLVTLVEEPAGELARAVAAPAAAPPPDLGVNALALDLRATLRGLLGYSR
jgi:UDP-N-acetylglucosamine transferase subunit ALG13